MSASEKEAVAVVRPTEDPVLREPGVWSRLWAIRYARIPILVCALFFLFALGAECYAVYCHRTGATPIYQVQNPELRNHAPMKGHILGTDYLGRDVLLRAVFATRTAVKVGIVASLISSVFGVALGLLGGYYGGRTDAVVLWIYSTFASIPSLLFILAFALLVSKGFLSPPLEAAFQAFSRAMNTEPGMMAVYLGIGLTGWVPLCRVVRAETLRLKTRPYVTAARSLGVNDRGIMLRHILPNLMHLVIVYFTMRFAFAVMTEVIVSYLGLGVKFEPSWGLMISNGQSLFWRGAWWEIAAATGFMFVLVLALNLTGDALRDALDPRHTSGK
jgi:peptide/nickel transport system permease protein